MKNESKVKEEEIKEPTGLKNNVGYNQNASEKSKFLVSEKEILKLQHHFSIKDFNKSSL